jgi:hypothetical protein
MRIEFALIQTIHDVDDGFGESLHVPGGVISPPHATDTARLEKELVDGD